MEFKETYEKDAGPIVRWIATKVLNLIHKIERPLYDYALMYEAVWEDEEDDFTVPHNQMMIPGADWHEALGDDEDYV
jgi:hypothetical protein